MHVWIRFCAKRKNLRHGVSFSSFSDMVFLPTLFHTDTSPFLCGLSWHFRLDHNTHLCRCYIKYQHTGRKEERRGTCCQKKKKVTFKLRTYHIHMHITNILTCLQWTVFSEDTESCIFHYIFSITLTSLS